MKFEELEVWKRSARLSAEIYKGIQKLKDYGFRDQLGRAGLSVPSNIAEGFERESIRECVNFLSYAKGSCGELRTQIYIGIDIGYIDTQQGQRWIKESLEISSMLGGLIRTKRKHLEPNKPPSSNLEPRTSNLEPRTSNLEPRTSNLEP